MSSSNKASAVLLEGERLENLGILPWYTLGDYENPEETPEGNSYILRILIDSDEGRAYEKLSTHPERLDYMRKHHHDKYKVIQTTATFYEDREEGKSYSIDYKSPEYEGLQKYLREDGYSWTPEDKEWDAMIQYFKDHATKVEDVPVRPSRLSNS